MLEHAIPRGEAACQPWQSFDPFQGGITLTRRRSFAMIFVETARGASMHAGLTLAETRILTVCAVA